MRSRVLLFLLLLLVSVVDSGAQASGFVLEFEDASDQAVTDLLAVVPLALLLFSIVFGVVLVRQIFAGLAAGDEGLGNSADWEEGFSNSSRRRSIYDAEAAEMAAHDARD